MSLEILASIDLKFVKKMWKSIGLSDDECQSEQLELNNMMFNAILKYQEKIGTREMNMKEEVATAINNYAELMQAFGKSQDDVTEAIAASMGSSLMETMTKTASAHGQFQEQHKDKINTLIRLHCDCASLYDRLEIAQEDRGEFAVVGNSDFTDARIQKFRETCGALQSAVDERLRTLQTHRTNIAELSAILEETTPDVDEFNVSKAALTNAVECEAKLATMKAMREDEIAKKKTELVTLWNVLGIRVAEKHAFTKQFKTLGAAVVQAYANEIDRLSQMKQERLPEIVEAQKAKIVELEAEMHLGDDQRQNLDIQCASLTEAYDIFEAKLEVVQRAHVTAKPIVDLITQRVALLTEVEQLAEAARVVEAAIKKKQTVDQKKVNKDEQSRRRIRALLPRLEKKLLILLIEHNVVNESDFLWDGSAYITELEHIKLSDSELRSAKTDPRKKSVCTSRRVSQMSTVSARGPEKSITRRSLQNHRAAANH